MEVVKEIIGKIGDNKTGFVLGAIAGVVLSRKFSTKNWYVNAAIAGMTAWIGIETQQAFRCLDKQKAIK